MYLLESHKGVGEGSEQASRDLFKVPKVSVDDKLGLKTPYLNDLSVNEQKHMDYISF